MGMPQDYMDCYEYLDAQFPELGGCEFYAELFPDIESSGELHSDFSHPNAVYLYRDEEKGRQRRRIMLKDAWEKDYIEYVEENPLTLCSGLVYRGRSNRLDHAQRMNALIFDLDGVGIGELRNLFLRFGGDPARLRRLPMPTFLVLSGTGLHVYYVFQEPIDLYPNIKVQLKSLKYDLTFRMWEYKGTSKLKSIQYQSINQCFRMVGSLNDKHGTRLIAFRTGGRVTLDYLNAYAKPENRVDINKPFRPSKMTRAQAKEAYPEWYERVVINGKKGRKKWDIAGKVHGSDPYALYHWWLRQIGGIEGGHRYFFLMCLAIYAYKCGVPKKQLREDMKKAFVELQKVKHENVLTEDDIRSALEAYDKEYYNFTISDIEALTNVRIERNKRNYRKQKDHVKVMNTMKSLKKQLGEEVKEGRPKGSGTAEQTVREWMSCHSDGKKADCIRETGLAKHTVYKWWKVAEQNAAVEAPESREKQAESGEGSLIWEERKNAMERPNRDIYAKYRGRTPQMDQVLKQIDRMKARCRELDETTDWRLRNERKTLHFEIWQAERELTRLFREEQEPGRQTVKKENREERRK